MGFFQDLREDLSQAVNEIPSVGGKLLGSDKDVKKNEEPEYDVDADLKELQALLAVEMDNLPDEDAESGGDALMEAVAEKLDEDAKELEDGSGENVAAREQSGEPWSAPKESSDMADAVEEDEMPVKEQEPAAEEKQETAEQPAAEEKQETAEQPVAEEKQETAEQPVAEEKQETAEQSAVEEPKEAEEEIKAEGEIEMPNKLQQTTREHSEEKPVVEAAATQIAGIADMVTKEEAARQGHNAADYEEREQQPIEEILSEIQVTENEESDIEKEVGKVVENQKMDLAQETAVDEVAIITAGMEITGDVVSKGNMEIEGCIKGNIEILGKLNVSGKIIGDSKAAEVFADSAKITGKIAAEGTVKIGENSVVIGNVEAASAVIAGAVKGDLDIQGPVILDTSAIVMGNIKSKSVQINNGAVIEGMCSQCYAEVNPTSFFENLIAK